MSQYPDFLNQLFCTGHVLVAGPNEPTAEEITQGELLAQELESVYRLGLPGEAPPFQTEPFNWAAVLFYRAAQFVVHRDVPAEAVQAALEQPFRGKIGHASIYSVDFVFRFLPDLLLLAQREAVDDPLTKQIQRWIVEWPLTAAGSPTESFSSHIALCRMYVERWVHNRKRPPTVEDVSDPRIRLQLQLEIGSTS